MYLELVNKHNSREVENQNFELCILDGLKTRGIDMLIRIPKDNHLCFPDYFKEQSDHGIFDCFIDNLGGALLFINWKIPF